MSVTRTANREPKSRATTGRPHARGTSGGNKQDRLALHRAKCSICKHPDREEIEREFLDWVSPREIAEHWKTGSYRAIYRHAHTVGLYEQRRRNWQAALDRIIERVGEVQVTAAAVISAIRLSAKLDREEKEKEAPGAGGRQAPFNLSMDGLPRTDAVTGHAEVAARRGDPPGRPPAEKASPKSPPSAPPRQRAPQNHDSPSVRDNVAPDGGKDAARPAVSAPPRTQPAPVEPDPRVALAEDGRVAGIPWPKGKVTFARRGRWRPGRGGR